MFNRTCYSQRLSDCFTFVDECHQGVVLLEGTVVATLLKQLLSKHHVRPKKGRALRSLSKYAKKHAQWRFREVGRGTLILRSSRIDCPEINVSSCECTMIFGAVFWLFLVVQARQEQTRSEHIVLRPPNNLYEAHDHSVPILRCLHNVRVSWE